MLRRRREYALTGEGQRRMRGRGITGPVVQVLMFRDVIRAEGLLCVLFFSLAVSVSELH